MAKSPVKTPPVAQTEAEEANVPSLEVENTEFLSSSGDSDAVPTLDPPSALSESTEEGFSAGVWNNNKKVNAVFCTNQTRNSWMSVVGTGWVKLANNIDSANEALTVVATAAKVKNSPINYLLDGGHVTQIYVW